MRLTSFPSRSVARQAAAALAIGISSLLAPAAFAGSCPADKVGVDVTKPGATEPKGVTDTVISSIDVGALGAGHEGYLLRMRRLVIEPGGVVPWHSHGDRPANIYVLEGEVTEYASTCAVPIVHKAGEVVGEFGALSHWWKNTGKAPAVLLSADLYHDKMGHDHPM